MPVMRDCLRASAAASKLDELRADRDDVAAEWVVRLDCCWSWRESLDSRDVETEEEINCWKTQERREIKRGERFELKRKELLREFLGDVPRKQKPTRVLSIHLVVRPAVSRYLKGLTTNKAFLLNIFEYLMVL
jgi:hypothetical protein